ncbi:hypothetical protein [Saccharopolyspora shandongensis]|uniref:hypothetical protein n=1 Tax=Saccharopolyspora shandongensis TaxID=418495 RepID=UPI0033C1AD36
MHSVTAWSWDVAADGLQALVVFFLPAVTTLVAYAVVFRVLLTTDGGVVNRLLGWLHLPPVD